MKTNWCCLPFFACMSIGCSSAVRATMNAEAPNAVAVSDLTEEYAVAPPLLSVEADVSAGASYTISFPGSVGVVTLDRKNLAASKIYADVDVASAANDWQLVADIARDEFLHAGAHPRGSFTSVALAPIPCESEPCEGPGFTLFGDLVLHGVTRRISMPIDLRVTSCEAIARIEVTIDRQEFGITDDGGYEGLVSDDVVVRIHATVPLKDRAASCVDAPATG